MLAFAQVERQEQGIVVYDDPVHISAVLVETDLAAERFNLRRPKEAQRQIHFSIK